MTVSIENSDDIEGGEGEAVAKSMEAIDPWIIGEIQPDLIDTPLEYIFADHRRQRRAAIILNMIAAGGFEERGMRNLIKFMKQDFARHIADEELGFFPLLRECCRPEDKIDPLIARLVDEHKDDESQGTAVIDLLEQRLAGYELDDDARRKILDFAEHIIQHLAVENAVLLPIARVRMDAASLKALSAMLRERRAAPQ